MHYSQADLELKVLFNENKLWFIPQSFPHER